MSMLCSTRLGKRRWRDPTRWLKKAGSSPRWSRGLDQAELDKRGIRGASIISHPNSEELTEITKLTEEKKIKPVVTQILSLDQAAKALEQAETHHTRGKIVIKIADESTK